MKIKKLIVSTIITGYGLINCKEVNAAQLKITLTNDIYNLKCHSIRAIPTTPENKIVSLEITKTDKCNEIEIKELDKDIFNKLNKEGVLLDIPLDNVTPTHLNNHA